MITVNNFQKKTYSNVIEIFTEKKLPKEIELYILSFLGPRDLQSAVQVSKNFKIFSINTAEQIEISFFHEFADFLDQNTRNNQIMKICSLGEKTLSNSTSLNALKSKLLDQKEEIINVLKNLDEEDFPKLKALSKNLNKSHFFHNVFYLAALYKQIEKIEKLDPSPIRDRELVLICDLLCRKGGNLSKAAEAASKISNESSRTKILEDIDKVKPSNEINSPPSEKPKFKSNRKTQSNHCIIS